MNKLALKIAVALLGCTVAVGAQARKDDLDVSRLNGSLDQLAHDPVLGSYAQAEQARARDAINRLAQAGRSDRPHDLYLAERRVDMAKASAQLQDAQKKLNQLDREHDQILLDNARREAQKAQIELERQRMQYQMAQEQAARLEQQGQQYSQAADQARAEAEQANKLAAAQSRVARAAKREAALASQAAKAMRSQMQDGSGSDAAPAKSSSKSRKRAKKDEAGHR